MLPGQGGEDDKTLLLLPLEYRQRMEAGNGCRRGLVGCVGTINTLQTYPLKMLHNNATIPTK